ncbi:MAG: 6-bladed beta-propeller [Parabacteroides sp.]|nr:6-bladed beta-propeller [Parabacteroides sp.]
MKTKLFISLFLVSICLYSCQTDTKSSAETYVIPVRSLLKENNIISIKDDIERITYIPLETTDSCLISNAFIVKMDKNKENIFVYNGKTDQVFQFNHAGKFIREVGRQGNGPGEHNVVLSLAIDDKNSEIYTFHYSGTPVVHSFDGKFLRNENIKATDMFYLSDHKRVLKGINMAPIKVAPWLAALQDNNLDITDSIVPYNPAWDKEVCYMQEIVFSPAGQDNVLAYTECNDTVFSISSCGCKSVCVLNRENTSGYHQNVADINQLKNNPVKDGDITLVDLFESPRFYYYRYYKDGEYYLQRLSKSDGSVLSQKVPESYKEATFSIPSQNALGIKNDIDGGVPFWPEFYIDSKTRAQIVTYDIIQSLKESNDVKDLPKELANLGEYDNPVIVLYTFK